MAITSCKPLVPLVVASNARQLVLHKISKRGLANWGRNLQHVDTLIIGGGPIGLSAAYHLATQYCNNDGSGITILERDPTYSRSSATLSAGGIRQQVVTHTHTCILHSMCTIRLYLLKLLSFLFFSLHLFCVYHIV